MAKAAATKGDSLMGDPTTLHGWTTQGGTVMSVACTFLASINKFTSSNVLINSKEAATVDSVADANSSPETTVDSSAKPAPVSKATISGGSGTVTINGKGAARNGDSVTACSSTGTVSVSGPANVLIGD